MAPPVPATTHCAVAANGVAAATSAEAQARNTVLRMGKLLMGGCEGGLLQEPVVHRASLEPVMLNMISRIERT